MSVLFSNSRRLALTLLVLALATQLLAIGLEKLFLLPDVPLLEAYQRAQPLGVDKAIAAAAQVSGQSPGAIILALNLHPAQGSLTALILAVLTATGLTWWRRGPWWLPLLVLPAALALTWSGLRSMLQQTMLYLANHIGSSLDLAGKFWLIGGLGLSGFLLLALAAARLLSRYSRAQAASAPGPRNSE